MLERVRQCKPSCEYKTSASASRMVITNTAVTHAPGVLYLDFYTINSLLAISDMSLLIGVRLNR